MNKERVIAYIDGFNLYFGLKAENLRKFYWLDPQKLARNLLKPHQILFETKYFTSRIAAPEGKRKRQSTYLEALAILREFKMYFGKYQMNTRNCRKCGKPNIVPSEKMTDVNIAVELLADSFIDRFDTALLISADSDLTAPILAIKRHFPTKRVILAFPPGRSSKDLAKTAHAYFTIGKGKIAKSQLPAGITKPDGFVLTCPSTWK